jgi:hypothetical protein
MRQKNFMAILFSLFIMTASYGQGWEQYYHNDSDSIPMANSLDQTADNGFIISASYYNTIQWEWIPQLIKTDVNGDTLWTKDVDIVTSNGHYFYDIEQTTDGGYILAGEISLTSGGQDMYLVKTDANGDTLWTKNYGGAGTEYCKSVQQTTDGGYIISGSTFVGGSDVDLYLVKTDANGAVLWTQTYGGADSDLGGSVEQTTDGGYVFIGSTRPGGGVTARDVYLVKTDANGIATWTETYGTVADNDEGIRVEQTPDGGYILASTSWVTGVGNNVVLTKVDALGVVDWNQSYGSGNYYNIESLLQTNGPIADHGYVVVGNLDNGDNYIFRTSGSGIMMWNNVRSNVNNSFADAVVVNNGYAVVGYQGENWSNPNSQEYVFLLKMDTLGDTYTNFIKGNIFNDANGSCLKETGELDFESVVVAAVGARTWYGTTDSLGNYCIRVDTGSYTVVANALFYWQACANNIPVTFTSFYSTDTVNFALQATVNCPMMEVDLSAPFIRTNSVGSRYSVNYCNNGTIDAANVYVEVAIDADLDVLGTELPIASQVGNTLTFNIGNVAYGDCGSFYIQVRAKTSAILGQTHCSQAHVFPDSLCLPSWGGGVVDVSAACQNDSVAFRLENIGGSLYNSETYYVFEDHVIMRTGNTGNILMGDSFTLVIPADTSKSYRITVPQNVGYPELLGDSIASAAIEGCVPDINGLFNTGFITQFSNGNSAPYIAIDCQENRGSYDPNDKSAQPAGYDAQHYIYSYTDLDYKVRFQNTGTDTAFLVVIRDTISPLLDLTTLTLGASSHDYTWRVYGDRVLEITFDNIMLPDSNVNELASNGFVRYRIEQSNGNVAGDVIYNEADIYFDFNPPIRTNETYHTIGENFVTIMLDQTKVFDEAIQVKVYPNPFTQNATLEVQGEEYNELQLTIYDVSGRVVLEKQAYSNNKIELSRGNLQPGVYLYQLSGDDALINTGKIVVQ